jgi:hypothetical protein
MRDIVGLVYEKHDNFMLIEKLADYSLIYPFEQFCVFCEKPTEINRNINGLHAENKPALRYGDEWEMYALNGVVMPKEYVLTPAEEIKPEIVLDANINSEVRREIIRKIGIDRFVKLAKVMDTQGDYQLLEWSFGDNWRRVGLKMKNPSIGVYHVEMVAPDCKSVSDALAFRNGTKELPMVLS